MRLSSLLIANRGEIAIRIARAAADLGIRSVAVFSEDDDTALHRHAADDAVPLSGRGVAAYLDGEGLIAAAQRLGCDAIHPGYGFLSENAAFAARCAEAGLTFVGPTPATLSVLGDKAEARALARSLGVPLVPGTFGPTDVPEVEAFVAGLGPGGAAMIKAVSGGGGRGMRAVRAVAEVAPAYERCRSEALHAFGNGELYVERLVRRARHIEVQVIGDGRDVVHAFERDCSLQRRNQKLIELAPAPGLAPELRAQIFDAALTLARHFPYRGLGTFEFLVDLDAPDNAPRFYFMEANPRLQVEHTVTEEATGLDLVAAQIRIAAGESLAALGLANGLPEPARHAIQLRVNMESLMPDGAVRPEGGVVSRFEPPTGPGIRVDACGYGGYRTNPAFDSLLAKLIVSAPGTDPAVARLRAQRALKGFRIDGVRTNLAVHAALLAMPQVQSGPVHTEFVQDHLGAILAEAQAVEVLPLAAGTTDAMAGPDAGIEAPEGTEAVAAPVQGVVASFAVAEGERVRRGQTLAILEAMKMEYPVPAPLSGLVRRIAVRPGDSLFEGDAVLFIEPGEAGEGAQADEAGPPDLDAIRPDLAAVVVRYRELADEARPEAVARRRARGQRTARENIADLCDPGSFSEYGALTVAAQRQRRTMDELRAMSPADGLVAGIGTVNAGLFGPEAARCMALAYDFTVFAGTQGWMGHKKKDRLFEVAHKWKIPVVLFGEGGGGRPGETDGLSLHGLDTPSFSRFASLSGEVPLVAIVSGRCFAGNAALVGCCDVTIATRDSNLGMSGPAMIEGGGLGVFRPEEIGPADVQSANGMVDLVVADEAEAVAAAKRYLSYFQGRVRDWSCPDQRRLRALVPENRRRSYDIREVIATLADEGATLELRQGFAPGMVTVLARIEGRPVGILANNPRHLGGAIDARCAEKAVRFMTLCDTFGLPILSLCDTPGFMVGPEAEKAGQVRASAAMFLAAAKLTVPVFTVVLRKGYGLGAQSMAAGCFHAPVFNVAWPTGEFGGMGIEGAVRLGYRRELAAIAAPDERARFFEEKVAHLYDVGKAVNMAALMEIDAVIDPAETRAWILRGLATTPPRRAHSS